MADRKTDTVVIGGGPGGYAAAFMAADLGQETVIVDPRKNPGGVCLYEGCIPSKMLLHLVKLKHEAESAESWGLSFGKAQVDLDKMRDAKDRVISQLTKGLGQLSKQRHVTHIRGTGKFKDANTLEIAAEGGKTESLTFSHAIVATGSRPVAPPGMKTESNLIMFAEDALSLPEIPNSLLVVGGGYIGLEMGTVYARLGAKVTIVEMTEGLIPGADRDLVKTYQKASRKTFDQIHTHTIVSDLEEKDGKVKVGLRSTEDDNESRERTFDRILLTTGRRPNSDSLGLEHAGITVDEKGFIPVNEKRQTETGHIYAIGDITGAPLLAHKASHEGRVAAEVIAGKKSAYEPATIPAVLYTDPEIAWCGLTEREAAAKGVNVTVTSFPWAASGRAVADNAADGKTKLVVDPESERILGVGIVGRGADSLIAEGALAVEMAALARDVSLTVHPHPTMSETIMEAAEVFHGMATHIYRPAKET